MTDESLDVEKLRAHDPVATAAFREVVRRFVASYFKNASQAEELVQEAMLELWTKLKDGAQPKVPRWWAQGAANNAVRRELTRLKHATAPFDSTVHRPRPADQSATYRAREELNMIINHVLAGNQTRLDALEGLILGEDHRELADRLGITPGAARMVVARLRAKLKQEVPAKRALAQLLALPRLSARVRPLPSSESSATGS